mmetsp:Transcript_7524/g.15998  ORF Transcript_7524/g.15998 Transcript_7524/m.15998 type:complete len:81 (-) Transcript_7524:39-281(-)
MLLSFGPRVMENEHGLASESPCRSSNRANPLKQLERIPLKRRLGNKGLIMQLKESLLESISVAHEISRAVAWPSRLHSGT